MNFGRTFLVGLNFLIKRQRQTEQLGVHFEILAMLMLFESRMPSGDFTVKDGFGLYAAKQADTLQFETDEFLFYI